MKKRRHFETEITRLVLIASVPFYVLLIWTMLYAGVSIWLTLLVGLFGGVLIIYVATQIYHRVKSQFRRLGNVLDSMTTGDYTLRARSDRSHSALDELVTSINALAERLSQQRAETMESQLLLNTVITHIDVAIIALNRDGEIGFLNPAAVKLLPTSEEGSTQVLRESLAFAQSFSSGQQRVVELQLGRQTGKYHVHVEEFWGSGMQNKLLFLTDVGTLLRSEERKAWQSLVRVISHEINNSLTPIVSISQTLHRSVLKKSYENENLEQGLSLISTRAEGLRRFIESYKQLTRLPEPKKEMVPIAKLVNKTLQLFSDSKIIIVEGEGLEVPVDPVQFEQVIINLLKNAVESMNNINPDGTISVKWIMHPGVFTFCIYDEGVGISNPDNLFVPFYSTKKGGSGIGLLLCRQIIEAHGGRIKLSNREDDIQGCCARIELWHL